MHEEQAHMPGAMLLIQPDGLPRMVEQVDGVVTGLNAIGLAIVEAGFTGVRGLYVPRKDILWQGKRDTPEGVYFACLCERAKRGLSLPSVEQVLEIIRPFARANEGRMQ